MENRSGDAAGDVAGDWAMIAAQLPLGWRDLAVEMGVVGRKFPMHMGTKVTDVEQVLRPVLYQVATNSSLAVTVSATRAAGIIEMSAVGLHKRMRTIGPYLAQLVTLMTQAETTFSPELWAGYDPIAVDGSSVTRPGAEGTTARVHYALRLSTLQPVQLEVTDITGGETFRNFNAEAGQLWIADRGYANPPGVAAIMDQGADVLVRHNRGSLPLYDTGGRILDVQKRLANLDRPGVSREWYAEVRPHGGKAIAGRLCGLLLPPDKAREARQRARREQGASVTKETLAAASYVVVFTTVPRSRLTADLIMELYRLRWQIELHIKRDKSIAGLDRLPNFRNDTIYSWICAKLLLTQIARKLATPKVSIPPFAHGQCFLGRNAEKHARRPHAI
jgi:Transposase DDE domain